MNTVGRNRIAIENYIRNQLVEDKDKKTTEERNYKRQDKTQKLESELFYFVQSSAKQKI